MKEKPDLPNYKDLWFRGIACLLVAHYIVKMGRPSLTTFEALMEPTYLPTLLINYAIALIVGLAVKKATLILDKKFRWYDDIWRRAMLQFTLGVMAVSILSFFLVWIYFAAFNQDIVSSGYLNYELPFSIALIAILNLYYVAYYFYTYPRPLYNEIEQPVLLPIAIENDVGAMEPVENIDTELQSGTGEQTSSKKRESIIVDTPLQSISIKIEDIIMVFILNKTVFIRMNSMKSLNDCFQVQMTLGDIMEMLGGQDFFRISRQCIVHFSVIGSYRALTRKTLLITLREEPGALENINEKEWKKISTVAEDRVNEFKNWMNR